MLKTILFFSLFINLAIAQDLKQDALKSWANRDDQKALMDALSKFEGHHKSAPQDLETLTYLARGYFTLAEYYLTDDEDKLSHFDKARSFGERALSLNPDYKNLAGDEIEKAIDKLTVKEVAPLYWSAASLGKWAKLNGIMSSLRFKGQILASIRKVEKLQPDFYYGAVPRYWGGFYAVAPAIAGGDMAESKKNFMKAMGVAPEYLGNKTLYAELYLVKKENEKDFKKVLEEVITAPNGPEEITPENKLEKKKAQRLLSKMKELF
jgi:tetratricopeptide (TPR) repeat protein